MTARLQLFFTRPATFVFLIATVLAVVVTYPIALHFGEDIYGTPGDATGAVTNFWWWGYAVLHGHSVFDNVLEGVPLGSGWSQIPFLVLPLVVFTPLSVLIGPIASYNLFILSGFPLTAWASFLLLRRVGLPALASAFGSFAFAFSPYHVEKAQGHANQTHMEFIALTLYFLVRWRVSGRKRDAALAGLFAGLQLWMDYSLAYLLIFTVLVFFAVSMFVRDRGEPDRPRRLLAGATGGAVMAAVTALFLPFTVLAFHRPGSGSFSTALGSVQRSIDELQIYSARIYEYVEPWHANPLLPSFIRDWEQAHLHGSNWTESSLSLGYVVMAMAGVGLLFNRRRFPTSLAVVLILVGGILSAPPISHLLGVPIKMPSFYLFQFISFFRVYARFAILVMLGVCILAAGGFAAVQTRLGSGSRQLLLALPFLVLALEFNNQPPTHVTAILPAPAEYAWLAGQQPGTLMEYPAHSGNPTVEEVQVRQYELYQMVHLHPTFLNESPTSGTVADAAAQLEPYYGPGVVARLKAYGVRWIFVHRDDYLADGWQLPTAVDGLTYVEQINGVDIYSVN